MADLRHRMAPAHVPEAFVVWLWEHRHTNPDLTTTDGIPLQVIYPGRRGSGWGPDLRGALLAIAGRVVRGDVEVHVTARDWARHGHARDSAYDGTVLHVVLEAEPGVVCYRSDGAAVPTVALQAAIAAPLPLLWRRWQQEPRCRPPVEPCRTPEEAAALLDEAGMERFATRVDRYEADIALVGAPQALWAGLCDALGYTANRTPFRALADRVPVQDLLSMRSAERPLRGQAVLFGAAGLLPHQRGRLPLDGYARALLREWELDRRAPRESTRPPSCRRGGHRGSRDAALAGRCRSGCLMAGAAAPGSSRPRRAPDGRR